MCPAVKAEKAADEPQPVSAKKKEPSKKKKK
jgi:hypothetical protein